jgi:alpha-tubulin suppressor-like RCC1 family protein
VANLGMETQLPEEKTPGSLGAGLPAISLGTGLSAKSVMAAVNYTCALLSNNSVKCWGQNTYGQLGLGDTTNRGVAANQMGDFLPSVDFGSGSAYPLSLGGLTHSCVLMSDSKVKCWGYNLYANLGIGNTTHWGTTSSQMGAGFAATGLGTDFIPESVYVGGHDTCAVSALGKVKCWGTNVFGQLGRGDTNAQGDDSNEMDDNLPLLDVGT